MKSYKILRLTPENIYEVRKMLGLSRDKLAEYLDLFPNEVMKLENDESSRVYIRFKTKAKNKLNELLRINKINIRIS